MATDAVGATGSRAYTVIVNGAIGVNPASLPPTTLGASYNQTLTAAGGNGSFTYSISAGVLPAGLLLNAGSGVISGTSTAAGTFNFTATATDSLGATGSRAYSVVVNSAIMVNPATLPATTVGVPYSQTVSATGGTGAVSFSVSAGALPAGLALNASTGVISGTPTTAATSNFTITATDTLGVIGARAYSVSVNAAIAVNPATLPAGAAGTAYSQTISAIGGSGTYTFSVSGGTLPPGLTLNPASGVLAGMPTTAASYNFSVMATDALGATAVRAYTVAFNAAVTVGPATLPAGAAGTAYSQTISAGGGTGSYTYSVSAGTLPPGLSLNPSTGVISGTPTTAATSNFTITATDGSGFIGSRAYALTVAPPTLNLVSPVSNGTVGSPYNQAIVVTGGTAPYTYAVSGGQLPPGLSLDAATGALTGVPMASGTYPFTVTVTDANGATGVFAQSVSIAARPDPTLDPSVRSVIAGQASAAARFGAAQIDNVTSRMRVLHLGYDPCSTQIDIGTNIRWEREPTPVGATTAGETTARAMKAAESSQEKQADGRSRSGCERPFAVWAAGNIEFGFLQPNSAPNRNNFRSSGLTLGADTRVGEGLLVGAAIGYARDTTDSSAVGTDNTAHAQNLMLYASYEPAKSVFIDAMVGYGNLSFDAPRWQSSDMLLLSASRSGSQFFGSLGVGAVLRAQGASVAPYGRYDAVRSRFDAYSESGSAAALSYDSTSVSTDSVAIGLYLGYSLQATAAVLEPGLRIEQRRVRSGSIGQGVAYADMPSTNFWLSQPSESENLTTAALSLLLRFGYAASVGLEYSYTGSSETFRNESVRAIFRAPF
ncbi:MAG: putative Ig domain-containing protein [Mycobacterium sp.]